MGADKFLTKPMEPEEFVRIIQSMFRDAEEGKIAKKKPVVREEENVQKLYSERIVRKLEQKMLELETEITERKKAEHDLKERVKELECLYSITIITDRPAITLDAVC